MSKQCKLKRVIIKEELVALTGDYIAAIVLNQFLYWSERTNDFDQFLIEERDRDPSTTVELTSGWIYKTAENLSDEIMVTVSSGTVRRRVKHLVENGWLDERRNPKFKWDRTLQYRPNIYKIQRDLHKIGYTLDGYPLQIDPSIFHCEKWNLHDEDSNLHTDETIPETTTETTTETTPDNSAQGAGDNSGSQTQPSEQEHDEQLQEDPANICPDCHRPIRTSRATPRRADLCKCQDPEFAALFGSGPGNGSGKSKPMQPDQQQTPWIARNSPPPWANWSKGRFSERDGVSVDSQDRIGKMLADATGERPRTDGLWNGWANTIVGIYNCVEGRWDKIEEGIEAASSYGEGFVPHIPSRRGETNGWVNAVARAGASGKRKETSQRRFNLIQCAE